MYDTSIPTLAYVFISLTSLVITYSHIMSNQDEVTNQDGMPEFVDKEIIDEDMIQVDEPEKIEEVVAPVEVNAVNNVAEQKELLNPQAAPPQMNPPAQENPVNLIPANQEEKPEAIQEENKNQGGKKKKTKKNSKKQKQSRRTLRLKRRSSKRRGGVRPSKKKIHVMKGGSDTEPDSDSDSDYSYSDFRYNDEEGRTQAFERYKRKFPGHYAAMRGDKDGVNKYVFRKRKPESLSSLLPKEEYRVNSHNNFGETMLYIAIKNQNPRLVHYLLNGLKADYSEHHIKGNSILELTLAPEIWFQEGVHNRLLEALHPDHRVTMELEDEVDYEYEEKKKIADAMHDMIITKAREDGKLNDEQYRRYIRSYWRLGNFFGESDDDSDED